MNVLFNMAIIIVIVVGAIFAFTMPPSSNAISPLEMLANKKYQDSLDPKDSIYNSNASQVLGVKNLSYSPYRTTDERYFEQGILKSVGNVTNNQTFFNTYLSNDLIVGRGNGTFETPDGQSIAWISSDLGRQIDKQWVYYGIILFNSTDSKSLSLLNNSIGISKSSYPLMEPEYIWLLK